MTNWMDSRSLLQSFKKETKNEDMQPCLFTLDCWAGLLSSVERGRK